jgi:HEAT repeat protein/beta-lactamase regulating signal transducer with metallopeptidase domain
MSALSAEWSKAALVLAPWLWLVLKGTVFLALVFGAAAVSRRASAAARHLIWSAGLVGVLLFPVLAMRSPLRLPVVPVFLTAGTAGTSVSPAAADAAGTAGVIGSAGTAAATRSADAGAVGPVAAATGTDPGFAGRDGAAGSEVGAASRRGATSPGSWLASALGHLASILLCVWALGVALLLGRYLAGALAVRRIVHGGQVLAVEDWTHPLWEVADRLELRDAPLLLRSEDVAIPFTCGVLRPAIVLPREADAWSRDQRRAVLLHEAGHIRRRDVLSHLLGRAACAFYWFHPMVWLAARRLRSESERACDDLALVAGTRPSEYAGHLLSVVAGVRRPAAPLLALPMARRNEFEGRVLAVLEPGRRRHPPGRWQSVFGAAALAGGAIVVSAMAPATARNAPGGARASRAARVAAPASHADLPAARAGRGANTPADTPISSPAGRAELKPKLAGGGVEGSAKRRSPAGYVAESKETAPALYMADTDWNGAWFGKDKRPQPGDSLASLALEDRLLHDESPAVRRSSAWALARLGGPHASLALESGLSDRDAGVREMAAWALGEMNVTSAGTALAAAVQRDSSAQVRETAAWALGQLDGDAGTAILAHALLGDGSSRVRATAAWALARSDSASAMVTSALSGALADQDKDVRLRAAWALGQLRPASVPPGLIKVLGDSDADVRVAAAWALGRLRDSASVPALEHATQDSNADVRRAAAWALMRTDRTAGAKVLIQMLQSSDPQVRETAARALGGDSGIGGPWPWPWPMPRPRPEPMGG